MENALAVALGLGLAAAAGLRLFVPAFVVSMAAQMDMVQLIPTFQWLANPWVGWVLGVAMLLEIAAYLVPWLDNLLDVVALPAATVAGAILAASVMVEVSPALRWILAVIAGGGTATAIHGLSATGRATSSVTTAGLFNPVLSGAETAGSIALSVLAILVPAAALVLSALLLVWILRRRRRVG